MVAVLVVFLVGLVGLVSLIRRPRPPPAALLVGLAMRNFRRGKWRTVLAVLGLLCLRHDHRLPGAWSIGDTVNAVSVHFTYRPSATPTRRSTTNRRR